MKNTPKNIHKWWSMQDQLDQEDKEKEEAEQKKLDAQRQEAERIYWEEKKKREEEEKKKAEATEGESVPPQHEKPVSQEAPKEEDEL